MPTQKKAEKIYIIKTHHNSKNHSLITHLSKFYCPRDFKWLPFFFKNMKGNSFKLLHSLN